MTGSDLFLELSQEGATLANVKEKRVKVIYQKNVLTWNLNSVYFTFSETEFSVNAFIRIYNSDNHTHLS